MVTKVERQDFVKILFELEPDAWHGSPTETLRAEPVGARRFKLHNVPFYAREVSFGDVVFGEPEERSGVFVFRGVSIRSGHSTYRIITAATAEAREIQKYWQALERIGCTYEQGDGRLRAVDVPPGADIYEAYRLLDAGEQAGIWDFEEGHCGHPLRE